jgi:hypothetical protein
MPGNLRYEALAIPDSSVDHDRTGRPNTTSIMSADLWEQEKIRGRRFKGKQYSNQVAYTSPRTSVRDQAHASRLRFRASTKISSSIWGILMILISTFWIVPVSAVFIEFSNCLDQSYKVPSFGSPEELQFTPYFLFAVFNTTNSAHNLAVQVWGNVSGSGPGTQTTAAPSSTDIAYWQSNSSDTYNGKIADEPDPDTQKLTTLSNKVTVLTYEPYTEYVDFCNQLVNGSCPLGPSFNASM